METRQRLLMAQSGGNATVVGILVFALGASEFLDLRRWEEGLEAACGLWLIASPFTFGYATTGILRYWHFVLGATVVVLAVLELRQDWKLSDAGVATFRILRRNLLTLR